MMPNGQMTEQYMRPKTRVTTTNATITPALSASNAGHNCISASHDSQWCSTPETSTNSRVTSMNITASKTVLIFLSIVYICIGFCVESNSSASSADEDSSAERTTTMLNS